MLAEFKKKIENIVESKRGTFAATSSILKSKFGASSSEPEPVVVMVTPEVTQESLMFDFVLFIIKIIIGVMLVQKIVPQSDSYQNTRIMIYILLVLGGGNSVFFLILLWFLKMQITKSS